MPIGAPLLVNTYTPQDQFVPQIGRTTDGGFVVTWTDASGLDGGGDGAFARRFDSLGGPLGDAFLVNTYTTGSQNAAGVAAAPNGNILITRFGQSGDYGIFARLYDAAGIPLGTEFKVNSDTSCGFVDTPQVDDDGHFLLVWQSGGPCGGSGFDGSGTSVSGRRVDSTAGAPLGTEFVINTYTTGSQYHADVERTQDGFVVVWVDGGRVPKTIQARRLDGVGVPLGSEIQVNSDDNARVGPRSAGDSTGGFQVIWTGEDGSDVGVFARKFDENDQGLAPDILVNTATQGYQFGTHVLADADGSFLVVFTDLEAQKFAARRLDSTGVPTAGPFDLPIPTNFPIGIDVLPDAAGGLTIAWSDSGRNYQAGSDIFVQRFACDDAGSDTDGDGVSDVCDPCPSISAASDPDVDCIVDANDNCPGVSNSLQADSDADTVGDACDLCDPGDDSIDMDGDQVGDCADLCVNAGGAQTVSDSSSLRFKFINNTVDGDDRFAFKGDFTLPPGMTFDMVDPVSTAVTIKVVRSDGTTLFERSLETVASTALGWTLNGSGTKWTFQDKPYVQVAGIARVNLQDRSKKAAGQVRVQIKGAGAYYVMNVGDEPHKVIVQLGLSSDSCAESDFDAADCRYTALDTTLSCKK